MRNKPVIAMVVEDEQPLLEAIKIKLNKNNFEVVTARSVNQAMNFLKDIKKIDVIWLDHYLLGKENGLDFVAKVKNNETWKKIPIFVVSNTATADKVKTYLELGVTKYFTKSDYRLDEIINDISKSLEQDE
jgi:DNA-binding response OmpR family regulator